MRKFKPSDVWDKPSQTVINALSGPDDDGLIQVHRLKTVQPHFQDVKDGRKKVEVRIEDDKIFAVGDVLFLEEWDPGAAVYTGDVVVVRVTHILRGRPYLAHGNAALSIELEREEFPQLRPLSDLGCECDWGRCSKPAIGERFSQGHGWLPVCPEHAE